MGWTSIHSNLSNKDFVADYLTDDRVLETSIKGNEVYQLAQTQNNKDDLYIRVTILSRKDGEIYYKDMDETCGPFYYNCPEKFLKRSTQKGETAKDWRETCRQIREQKAKGKDLISQIKNLKNGDRVEMQSGRVVVFEFNYNRARFAGYLADVKPGKQNSTFAWSYKEVTKILK